MTGEAKDFFDTIKKHQEDIDWILRKQTELRAELMTFYKKDLNEIQSALIGVSDKETSALDSGASVLDDVQKYFTEQWLKSYDIITPTKS